MIRMIAGIGGYVSRPKTAPGTQTLWIGLQQLYCFALSGDAFGPGSKNVFRKKDVWYDEPAELERGVTEDLRPD